MTIASSGPSFSEVTHGQGKVPVTDKPDSHNDVSFDKSPRSLGLLPVNALLVKSKYLSSASKPSSVGRVPCKFEFLIFNDSKFVS